MLICRSNLVLLVSISQKIEMRISVNTEPTTHNMTSIKEQQNMIINATTFSADEDAKYMKPKLNKSGGKSVGVLNSTSGKTLYLSTPLMLTWGVSEFVDEKTGRKSYDMSLQFPRDDYRTSATDKFLENMTAFQAKLKADCIENSKDWMNKSKMSPEVVDALFHPMLKHPKDPETGEPDYTRAPTLRVKLDYWDEKFNCEVYDLEQKLVFPSDDAESSVMPIDLIEKGSNVAVVIRCGGLWFANGKFGCTWKLVQAVVKPKASLKGRCLITLSADETAKMKEQSDGDDEDATGVVLADDSDDDDDDGDDVVEDVVEMPPPAPKAKVVRKKVVRKKKSAEANA